MESVPNPARAEQVRFLCCHCGTHSRSEVIATEHWTEYEQDGTYRGGPEYRYQLVKCTACRDVSLLIAMQIAWDEETEDGTGVYEGDHAVYPAPPRNLSSKAIPKTLQRNFQEARACYQVRAYNASAIMCRRALELLALERGINDGSSLDRSLARLKDQGDIDQRLFDWCDALRLAGNQAAHKVDQDVTQADAKDKNELTEAIIDYVYVFQDRYEKFKKRRTASRARHSRGLRSGVAGAAHGDTASTGGDG